MSVWRELGLYGGKVQEVETIVPSLSPNELPPSGRQRSSAAVGGEQRNDGNEGSVARPCVVLAGPAEEPYRVYLVVPLRRFPKQDESMPPYAVIPDLECIITVDGRESIAMVGQILSVDPVRVLGMYRKDAAVSEAAMKQMRDVLNSRVDAARQKVYGGQQKPV